MAEALVSLVVEQLGSKLGQEVRLGGGFKKEVGKLTRKLTAIQAVLADAETRQVKEATVRDWLEKLKDITYDIEDVLDDWKAAILSSQSKPDRKVCSSCFCCKQVGPRHDIAKKLKGLKERLDLLDQDKERYKFVSTKANQPIERSMTISMIDITEVKGREEDKDKLVERLLSESSGGDRSDLRVLSIVGMGGIGKTTLAQFAFNDNRIEAYFDKKIWICVSDPFYEIRIAKTILESLSGSTPHVTELETLLQEIKKYIKNKKILLIMDDVWENNFDKWNKLKQYLKVGSRESKILLTTRKEIVATVMGCSKDDTLKIGLLSEEDCWLIVSKIAFFGKSNAERNYLEATGREISKKCRGLPLAAKTLGGILQFRRTKEEWQSILKSKVWEFEEAERDVIALLWLSYYDLSPMLKRCFSYCAIFPKGREIKKRELIELWMAQDYFKQSQSDDGVVIGEKCFQNLAIRSFFQDFKYDEFDYQMIDSCKMHDIVHDFAQMVAWNECCSVQMVDDPVESIRTVRHLCLHLPKHGSYLNPSHGFRKKRSLFLWSQPTTDELSSLFSDLTHVRSLSLRDGDFAEIPSSISKMVQLRWLDLSYCWKLKQLPETLCELHSLQTLDVSGCSKFLQLPLGIGKLINLRHLHNLGGPTELPKGIGELTGLRTLEEVDVDCDGNAFSLGDLKNLNQLRGSLRIKGLGARDRHAGEAKQAELRKKEHITQLDLRFSPFLDREEEHQLLEALEPSPNLEILEIEAYNVTTFPGWMISLTNLRSIRNSGGPSRLLKEIAQLTGLRTLEKVDVGPDGNAFSLGDLKNLNQLRGSLLLENVGASNGHVGEAKQAELKKKEHITHLSLLFSGTPRNEEFLLEALEPSPNLEILKIFRYRGITFPGWMISLTNLKSITLQGCESCEHLPSLGKLPSLETLELYDMSGVKKVGVELLGIETQIGESKSEISASSSSSSPSSSPVVVAFPKLTTLQFSFMESWEGWDDYYDGTAEPPPASIMPSLHSLEFYYCPRLKALPDYILQNTKLHALQINYCGLLEERYKKEEGEDWSKISHIPHVTIF